MSVPAPTALQVVFNSPSHHGVFREAVHDKGCGVDAMLSGTALYDLVLEMSPIVRFSSFPGATLPQDLLFKAQDSISGSDAGHVIYLQPSGCLHYC